MSTTAAQFFHSCVEIPLWINSGHLKIQLHHWCVSDMCTSDDYVVKRQRLEWVDNFLFCSLLVETHARSRFSSHKFYCGSICRHTQRCREGFRSSWRGSKPGIVEFGRPRATTCDIVGSRHLLFSHVPDQSFLYSPQVMATIHSSFWMLNRNNLPICLPYWPNLATNFIISTNTGRAVSRLSCLLW